jgi:hypothetical protein
MTNLGFTAGLHKLSVPSFEILQEVFISTPHPCSCSPLPPNGKSFNRSEPSDAKIRP